MPELIVLTGDTFDEPMLPNLSQGDADGCLWICINPGCPELCARSREPASLRRQVRELRRRSVLAAAAADRLGIELVVSYHSDDFAAAQDAQRALAAAAALCAAARHAAADAEHHLAGVDPGLPVLLTTSEA